MEYCVKDINPLNETFSLKNITDLAQSELTILNISEPNFKTTSSSSPIFIHLTKLVVNESAPSCSRKLIGYNKNLITKCTQYL